MAVSETDVPEQTLEAAAEAPTSGAGLTVNVNGTETEVQPVLLLRTVIVKSYVPAGVFAGILTLSGEALNAPRLTGENPDNARVPALILYWSGAPVAV